jgi:hypothetical protein
MVEVAAQAIEPPADQHVTPPASGLGEQVIQGWPALLGPTHTAIDVLHCRPAARLDVAPQFLQLVLWFLVEGTHAGIDGGPHCWASVACVASVAPAFRI